MPFTIQAAEGESFFDREVELKEILGTLQDPDSAIGFALYGKRRMGKTSIFKETRRRLTHQRQIVPIYFSLWDVVENNVKAFTRELSVAVLESYGTHLPLPQKIRDLLSAPLGLLRDILSRLKIGVELEKSITLMLSIDREKGENLDTLLKEALLLPEKLAKKLHTKSVIFLDEFPDIVHFKLNGKQVGEGILQKIRSIHEDYKHTALNISGSIRKTMEQAVLSSASPFYRQFILKEIGPFSKEHVRQLLQKNLPRGVQWKPEGINTFYQVTAGIPFYVQFLGKLLKEQGGSPITPSVVHSVRDHFLQEEGNLLFTEEFENLSIKEKRIARCMAGKVFITYADLSTSLRGDVQNVRQFLAYLESKGIVERIGHGEYRLEDPLFSLWIAQRFP